MTATKSFSSIWFHPQFAAFVAGSGRWVHKGPDGVLSACKDFEVSSPFGKVKSAVVLNKDGSPSFDRPIYYEADNVSVVAWGRGTDGKVRIAVIRQPRPHADDPEQPGDEHEPVVFGQVPMGFLEKLIGKDVMPRLEASDAGAVREVGEETGAKVVLNVTQPKHPYMYPNPTFCATWSNVYFVEVDLTQIERLKLDHNEPIYSAEYIAVPELLRRIRDGKDEQGAVYRMGVSLADLMLFFAVHSEYFLAE